MYINQDHDDNSQGSGRIQEFLKALTKDDIFKTIHIRS